MQAYTLARYNPVIHPMMVVRDNVTGSRDHFKVESFENGKVYDMDINYHGLGFNLIQQGKVRPAIPLPLNRNGKPLILFEHAKANQDFVIPGPETGIAVESDITKYEGQEGWDVQDFVLDPSDIPDSILNVGNPGGAKQAGKEDKKFLAAQVAAQNKADGK